MPVLSVSSDETPHRVVLMLDASGSMTSSKQQWATARFVSINALQQSPGSLSWALIVFRARVLRVIPFGHSREEIISAIIGLEHPEIASPKESGKTALIDNLDEALKLLGRPRLGDATFAVTDGTDNVRKTSPAGVEKELITEGVRVFAHLVMATPGRYYLTEEEAGRDDFLSLIKNTGGSIDQVLYTTGTKEGEFEAALRQIYRAIAAFYRLEVQLPEGVLPGKKIRVSLLNSLGKGSREYRVAYPIKLGNCQPDSR